jgi:hypothetical protein
VNTSLIAPVGAARELLRPWHDRFEPWARHGIAPHVTLVSPFVPADRIRPDVEDRLASAVDACMPLDVVFDRVELLPGATCLLPVDDVALRHVTAELLRPWPDLQATLRTGEHRPYHLTVAATEDLRVHDEVRSALAPLLPVTMRLAIVQLVAHDDSDDVVRSLVVLQPAGIDRVPGGLSHAGAPGRAPRSGTPPPPRTDRPPRGAGNT